MAGRLNLSEIKDLFDSAAFGQALINGDVPAMQAAVIPKYTTTARDALAAAARPEGLVIYNTTTHKLNVRVAAAWEVVTSA
jgi:hypothetical protein